VSNRDTFVTSFLYDDDLVPVLREALPSIANTIVEGQGKFFGEPRTVWFAGQCKNLYPHELRDFGISLLAACGGSGFDIVFLLEIGKVYRLDITRGVGVWTPPLEVA
jgi:hypothetical protein